MSWKKLLQERRVHHHRTTKQEISELRRLIDRDLADASIPSLQTAKMAIACAGYRVASVPGHHGLTFEGAKLAIGKSAEHLTDYFDACRRKRNEIDYTGAAIATGTEAEELLLHTRAFIALVEKWIETNHAGLRK
jgi:hypothetical protein